MPRPVLVPLLVLALATCGESDTPTLPPPPPPPGAGDIHVEASIRYQVISGWEAHHQSGEESPQFPTFRDQLFDLAVGDLGLTRIRLEVRSGMENTRDIWRDARDGLLSDALHRCLRYATVNDDNDPLSTVASGFHFGLLDHQIEAVALPLKQRIEARGERLFLNLTYVAFIEQLGNAGCPPGLQYHHTTPDEYAEFMLVMVQHLQSKYGLVPDAIEFLLEPEHNNQWSGVKIGQGIVATAQRLAAHGFDIKFIAPSTTNMANAVPYFDAIRQIPGAVARMQELSYHRYGGVSDANLALIASRASQHGLKTSMLEHIGSGHEDLHKDLTIGQVSSWQQFAIAYPSGQDNGGTYYVLNPQTLELRMGNRTRYLRQYFRWVRPGAQRVGASSRVPALEPVAFVHPSHGTVVVVKAGAAATFTVSGLPAGSYGVAYTTAAATGVEAPPVTITAGEHLQAAIPAVGVVTIYRR